MIEVTHTFDLFTTFFGTGMNGSILLEVVFRTLFLYLYALANMRLMPKRSIGQLTPSELLIVIALGSAVGDPMFYRQVPLIHGMLVVSIIMLLENIFTYSADRNRAIGKILEGSPLIVIKNGEINKKNLRKAGYSQRDLLSRLRIQGISHTGQIEYGYIETSGQLSTIKYAPGKEHNGISTLIQTKE